MPDSPPPTGATLKVLIVEDDPIIARVYKRTIASMDGLEVVGTVSRGEDAIEFLKRHHCDLMLLDLKLRGMGGITLLQRLRNAGHPIEVIALTAARNSNAVRALVQRGAIDYLVKPFTVERLRESLDHYLQRAAAFHGQELDQKAVDQVCAAGRSPRRWLPKGLTEEGVRRICAAIDSCAEPVSSTEVAEMTGLARVTAGRYLQYLVSTDQASVESSPSGPGRPRKLYTRAQSVTID